MQNTSLTPDDVGKLSIPQIEALFEGFAEINEDSGDKPQKELRDMDAVNELRRMGMLK